VSKTTITSEQRDLLLKAAKKAVNPGACKYVRRDTAGRRQPCCIIGQLLHLRGVTPAKLEKFDDLPASSISRIYGIVPQIQDFPKELLTGLQLSFDGGASDEVIERINAWPLQEG
jgi:hypothetical protein